MFYTEKNCLGALHPHLHQGITLDTLGDIFSVLSPPCAYFFSILSTIKMIFGQILVCFMTNISSMFWAQCWRLETSSRPFYDFVKITIYQDPAIFNSWYLPFLNVPYSPFQKNETLES